MKPIALTLKGINSFSEEQTIDFEQLTSGGIFGIFGPTGSGKSTILDGITLALYGEIARESKNFIHVGCDTAYVGFSFSVTDKQTRTYRVDRSFKRKKDTGYSVAAKARLTEFTGAGNELILEDSISGVKERIRKIIGLEFDDFTRTVVLPQGKFSEFLKLSGSDRNQMLERLFHLYDYGITLTEKIKKKSLEIDLLYQTCIGKLTEHAGEDEEALKNEQASLKQAKVRLTEYLQKQKENDGQYHLYRDVWERQKELEACTDSFRSLEEQKEAYAGQKKALEEAKKAAYVQPFDEQYQKLENEYSLTLKRVSEEETVLCDIRTEFEKAKHKSAAASEKKNILDADYQERLRKLEKACELDRQLSEYEQKVRKAGKEYKVQIQGCACADEEVEKAGELFEDARKKLEESEKKYMEHAKEHVLHSLYERMKKEGICPLCGQEYHGQEHVHADIMQESLEELSGCYSRCKKEAGRMENALSEAKNKQLLARTALAAAQTAMQSEEKNLNGCEEEYQKILIACGITDNPNLHREAVIKAYQDACKDNEDCMKLVENCREKLTKQELLCAKEQAKEEEQKQKLEQTKQIRDRKLEEYGFKDLQSARDFFWPAERIAQTQVSVAEYETAYTKLKNQIEILEAKLGKERIDKEAYEAVIAQKQALEEQIHTLREQTAVFTERIKKLEESLRIVDTLNKEKERLEHKKAILSELANLLKGKKFVEYVARERLSYVAGEASEKLMEITGGTYGLELRENGEFSIRDYKNGGIERNVNSLSGGEMFLVSLSLALALSTQIQLKGTAPLEFFFLDEGFGTLDEDLLDTVMDSLDKLHHDRRKIGIISHVEAIKERVPVKLIVTPAKAGVCGSRVEIVR